MGLFKRKPDPIHERARALNSEIAQLEKQIRDLSSKIESQPPSQLKVRSTFTPNKSGYATQLLDPVFEKLDPQAGNGPRENTSPAHFNELGMRKYDLVAAWKRLQNHFRGPAASNPKLVNYLAVGSINGLRPLRYEKRVARNRFILMSVFLLFMLWGVVALFMGGR